MGISREVLFVSSTVALVYSGMTLIFPVLPFYLAEVGGGAAEFGLAASSFALAVLIFSPVIGRIADKVGKVKVIAISLYGFAVTNFLFVFVTSYWHIIILRFFEGLSTAGVAPGAIAIASDLSEESNRARSIAFVTAGISFGVIIGPLLGGTLVLYYALWFPFVVSGILGLLAAVAATRLLEEPDVSPTDILSDETTELTRLQNYVKHIPKPMYAFGAVLIIQMVMNVSWLLIEPGFVYYFYDELNYNSQQFGIFVAAYGAFVFIGEIFFGGISDRFGRKKVIFMGSLIHATFYLYLSLVSDFVYIVVAAMIAGIALGLIGPALNALISEVSPAEKRTYIFGIVTAFAGAAQVTGPLVGGWAIDQGIHVTFLSQVSSALVLFSAFLVFLLNFDERKSSSPMEMTDRYLNLEEPNTEVSVAMIDD